MVKGIDIFRDFFKEYANCYILIGGAACDEHLKNAGLIFRATKDLDIILIVEALTPEFVKRFWQFVKKGNYVNRLESFGERKYYRFNKPSDEKYPEQLELFSRNPGILDLADGSHLTPIPIEEDLSSLSAILMDENYYQLTRRHSKVENNLHIAEAVPLICLKAKAFLDLKSRREDGETIDAQNIRKHKNDIIRLTTLLTAESAVTLPASIKTDMQNFIEQLKAEPPDYKQIGKNLGIGKLEEKDVVRQLIQTYSLEF